MMEYKKDNFQKCLDLILEKEASKAIKSTLLLHSCCAPCSSYVLEYLSRYFNIVVFFYNPNLYPDHEYEKRLSEQKRFIQNFRFSNSVQVIEKGLKKELFYEAVKGMEKCPEGGLRCKECFYLRLNEAAKEAKSLNADYFCTTLTISPHKDAFLINQIGQDIAKQKEVQFLPSDFKKRGGFKRSLELSKEYSLYRQDYCGCVFSYQESLLRGR